MVVGDTGELIRERDVYVPIRRLRELRQLGRLRIRHAQYIGVEHLSVKPRRTLRAVLVNTANNLRIRSEVAEHAPGRDALRAEGDGEVRRRRQAGCAF